MIEIAIDSEKAMLELGARLAKTFSAGEIVTFEGELGAGKTTLIRGILHELGWKEAVRSPTYNLFAVYETEPPVLHADLYRIPNAIGTGIEDYFDSHLCLIEWPRAILEKMNVDVDKKVEILFDVDGRRVRMSNISL